MKPYRTNRPRAYYQHHRWRVMKRKSKLVRQLQWHVKYAGMLSKGKIHCSCWMCSQKTKKDGPPHADHRRIKRMLDQLGNDWEEIE
ncbi:hypothetical protein G4V62_15225 [Bacillaceae bacterium SIJ1]|uniref:hypothetical protein n=1 Tax=Litoribacterium kuwaitense TaxID=1398745 RepID=UPI0013EC1D30|nr:hypothetical protein [Litoribacterium kuwaitense]NGP46238.1 hypothetical protein [Litoribacterium kuwaitense]